MISALLIFSVTRLRRYNDHSSRLTGFLECPFDRATLTISALLSICPTVCSKISFKRSSRSDVEVISTNCNFTSFSRLNAAETRNESCSGSAFGTSGNCPRLPLSLNAAFATRSNNSKTSSAIGRSRSSWTAAGFTTRWTGRPSTNGGEP